MSQGSEIIPIAEEDLRATERYLIKYDVKPSDAIHLATMDKVGITSIVGEDAELDAVKGIERVWLDATGQSVTEMGHEGQ
jgi:predicted nucleic acid-binding protein